MATRGGPAPGTPEENRAAAADLPEEDRAAAAEHPSRSVRNRGATALIGALLAILGFALAVQFRSTSQTDVLAGAREADLVRA